MRALVIILAICLTPVIAAAEEERRCEDGRLDQDVTCYDFGDDVVTADVEDGGLDVQTGRRPGARQSLLRVRTHFVRELVKSVENI